MAKKFPLLPYPEPLPLEKLKVFPLAQRRHLTRLEDILVPPETQPAELDSRQREIVADCAERVLAARAAGASVMLLYGAHLLRNGAALILERMMANGWITHLATNGAGTIHDWEFSWFGQSSESVLENVATGTFGTWAETGRNIHLALYGGSVRGEGYGRALGRYIFEDGTDFPSKQQVRESMLNDPNGELTGARADLLRAMETAQVPEGRVSIQHPNKHGSILAQAYKHQVPLTVHPGIGYDIVANHPMFNGALIGRAAAHDFRLFGAAVEKLDGGVVLSVGSAIMGPQVFEKSLSCVNNLRVQAGRPTVQNHSIYVVDLQDGGRWDWTKGEPPKNNPAYYLRFCKSYSRMGGRMQYLQLDNLAFVHNLYSVLARD